MKIILTSIILLSITAAIMFYSQYTSSVKNNEELETQIISNEYENWKTKYGKNKLSSTEQDTKFQIFKENWKTIKKYNQEHSEVELAINQFSDETLEEFKAKHLGTYVPTQEEQEEIEKTVNIQIKDGGETEEIDIIDEQYSSKLTLSYQDWEHRMPQAKQQGLCGGCWAMGAVAAIEGKYNAQTSGAPLSFSDQFVLDCNLKNHGCGGGFPEVALSLTKQYGIMTEQNYPYKSGAKGQDFACKYDKSKVVYQTGSIVQLRNNAAEMLKTIKRQPMVIQFKAGQEMFKSYSKGVILNGCQNGVVDHTVVIVGSGVQEGHVYWKVRNSWGTGWGENGHFRVAAKTGLGECGINRKVLFPL